MGMHPRNGIGRRNVVIKRKPRCVNLTWRDWNDPALGDSPVMVRRSIRKTQYDKEPGLPLLLTLLRVFTLYPHLWWTQGQVKKCMPNDWPKRATAYTWKKAIESGCIRKGRNPDFDSTRQAMKDNPIWFYKITQKGLWFVAMFE